MDTKNEDFGQVALNGNAATCLADVSGRIISVNEAFCRLLNRSQKDIIGQSIGSVKSANRPEAAFATMWAALESAPSWQEELEIDRDGRSVWVEATLTPVRDTSGTVIQYVLLLTDVTALKEAEKSLHTANRALEKQVAERTAALLAELFRTREHLDRLATEHEQSRASIERMHREYESILNSAGEGVYGINDQGICSFINPAAARMLGWEVYDLVDKPIHDLVHHTRADGRPYPASECPSRFAMREGRVSQVDDEVFWRKDCSSFDVAYTTTPIMDQGKIVGAVVVFSDITFRKQTERYLQQSNAELKALNQKLYEAQSQLLQSEKMASIGQLAAGLAHEINSPVGFVNSSLGALGHYFDSMVSLIAAYERAEELMDKSSEVYRQVGELKLKLDLPVLRKDVPTLMQESRAGLARVSKIVQDLKEFSRVDESEWQWADLHKSLNNTLNMVWNEIKDKAEIVKEYGDLPVVECLPFQINQVFLNLLLNAAQAIDGHGTITLRTGRLGEEVWVEIADTGCGIAPENLPRIFEPFFTTRPVGKGTGLGLSLAYTIVHKHHGRIEVDSKLGKGSVFRLWLPVRQPEKKAD